VILKNFKIKLDEHVLNNPTQFPFDEPLDESYISDYDSESDADPDKDKIEYSSDDDNDNEPISDAEKDADLKKKMAKLTTSEVKLFNKLYETITKHYAKDITKMETMIQNGVIDFTSLWYYFSDGKQIKTNVYKDIPIGGKIHSNSYGYRGDVQYFQIDILTIMCNQDLNLNKMQKQIGYYRGTKKIDDLPIKILDDVTKEKLKNRGKKYMHFLQTLGKLDKDNIANYDTYNIQFYEGEALYDTYYGPKYKNIRGRVLIDYAGYFQYNENRDRSVHLETYKEINVVPDDNLYMCWPYLYGFSLDKKFWFEFLVDKCADVVFNDAAIERLVLDQTKKNMLLALVNNYQTCAKDFIKNKGEGLIILLPGPPGVGKTSTAEVTAEFLHKPLYCVSSSELGGTFHDIESNLKEALEIVHRWNGIMLIDEADLFLERRTDDSSNLERNSIVCMFLSLLEYHKGIVFLTTNRYVQLDMAIKSRITLCIPYKSLSQKDKCKIWKNFLTDIDCTHTNADIIALSKFELNGREIKNQIRVAHCLAKRENVPLTITHINHVYDNYVLNDKLLSGELDSVEKENKDKELDTDSDIIDISTEIDTIV
jgi:hypothetical protein